MDRLSQLRGGAGGSRDHSPDDSAAGDSFLTANDTPSKYYSLSEDDSSFDITKEVSLAPSTTTPTLSDSDCFSNLSPIGKKDLLDYKIGKQIEAANILSGGVNIFDDNENSYDGNELVIDDNVDIGDNSSNLKSPEEAIPPLQNDNVEAEKSDQKPESSDVVPQVDNVETRDQSPSLKSLDSADLEVRDENVDIGENPPSLESQSSDIPSDKIDAQVAGTSDAPGEEQVVENGNILLDQGNGGQLVENGHLPLEGDVAENGHLPDQEDDPVIENGDLPLDNGAENIVEEVNENRTEVVLQIDGNNVAAINIGTGLYLYRKEGQEELAAVQIVEDEDEPSFKFLKVRENDEGNLEVYEEIQEVIVVPQETPVKEEKPPARNTSRETNKPANEPSTSKKVEKKNDTPDKDAPVPSTSKQDNEPKKEVPAESKPELNLNGKMVKFSESRKSPLMAYHSTPNKEGIPLTKTMVDQQLHPNRHSDNIKKTIEVHTDNCKQRVLETPSKSKDVASPDKMSDEVSKVDKPNDKETPDKKHISVVTKEIVPEVGEKKADEVAGTSQARPSDKVEVAKPNVNEVKAMVINKVSETIDKVPIVSGEEKNKTESVEKSEISTEMSHTSAGIENKESKTTTSKEDVKEKETPTASSSVEASMETGEVKIPENVEPIEKPIVIPTEIIESDDMEIDEDALVIEEQIIDSQPEIRESTNKGLELVSPPVEIQSKTSDKKETKKPELEISGVKRTTPGETKMSIVGTLNSWNTSKLEPSSTASLSKDQNININKSDILVLENNLDTEHKASDSLSKKQVEGTKPKDTQTNDKIKIIENRVIKESILSNEIMPSIKQSEVKESLTVMNSTAAGSTISTAGVNDLLLVNNLHNKPEKILSKLESAGLEIKEKLPVKDLNNEKTPSLPLIKEQRPTSLPSNTQIIAKLQVKPDIKPGVLNASEAIKEVNHKPIINAVDTKPKSLNNNHAPVPFGKWTEVNRQAFLDKIKESKPVNVSNANQIKQPNDLNRRDVLKKIDSQRQTYNAHVKIQESLQKGNVKTEAAFASKTAPATVTKRETTAPMKSEVPVVKPKPIIPKILTKKPEQAPAQPVPPEPTPATVSSTTKMETQRKEINNQDLIDKTIEGIINRVVTGKSSDDVKQTVTEKPIIEKHDKKPEQKVNSQPTLLDAIEMKMNELHGIPFVERPPHELPRPYVTESKVLPQTDTQNVQKVSKIPNLLPLTKSQQKLRDCEDDIMNLEMPREKTTAPAFVTSKSIENSLANPAHEANTSKDKIITEKEFDKFARRNSVTYENCLTVTDSHQVIQTVVPREAPKKISRNEQMLAEAKAKSPHKHLPIKQYHPSKTKYTPVENKQYQSKLQLAYQTAITKRRIDSPINIIEDKPVKVVYLDSNVPEFTSSQLNVQGRDLSPAKRPEPDAVTVGTNDSLDSDILDAIDEKSSEIKTKSKHQRKQVLTPVETPDLELIEPGDLGIEVSPRKKRKTDDKLERSSKLVPKKSYLLGRNVNPAEPTEPVTRDTRPNPVPPVAHSDAVSAIDNLVKAAELLENQAESMNVSNVSVQNAESPQGTPVKRGRGRPRKNPLPDVTDAKEVSPSKKPRLIDAKRISSSEEYSSDDDSMIKENWTMGKINEKIVCPICNKLFRSENVVFKHVKHCTGPSPSRSDSDKRSPRRSRLSQESDSKSRGSRQDDDDDLIPVRKTPGKRKSKDSGKSTSSDDVIPIETDPKESEKDLPKKNESRKSIKPKINPRTNNLVCEICGKSFRQLSYLVSHKMQHKKDGKRPATESRAADKSVFGCDTCKKEFRKLHHLVQHRLIHNPEQTRALRKSSSEQKDLPKTQDASKLEDQNAGFRCEPCDKSFRKLHHLVEHRETHDGINRQRSNSITQLNPEKEKPPPQCDICKKTFRKLHHLIEHKEQHAETSSEKSDDQKSVKSALSTKDIIHECNLCYMVFPNEHSLNKHAVICLRKKKQSAAKQAAQEEKSAEDATKAEQPEEIIIETVEPRLTEPEVVEEKLEKPPEKTLDLPAKIEVPQIKEDLPKPETITVDKIEKQSEPKPIIEKKAAPVPDNPIAKVTKPAEPPAKIKQVDEIIVIEDTPKKKVPAKEKIAPSVTKRPKIVTSTPLDAPTSSDDDEVRYMLNPDFKEDSVETKNFMKVRAKKRSSLQIERPNSKDLPRRRSLLQHPPKIPRLRAKSDDVTANPKPAIKPKIEKVEVPSTDSDDSDVKYSFPKTVPEKPVQQEPEIEKKRRKTMAEKRKSLSGIAKRKSMGKATVKTAPKPSPPKPIKRRTLAAEHRCDCGQLFNSAALLARHASLAHTPPRVRRPRDPPTDKPKPHPVTVKPKPNPPTLPTKAGSDKPTRKSIPRKAPDTAKTPKLKTGAHGGVPLPEKRTRK